jgi:hypothetical protein
MENLEVEKPKSHAGAHGRAEPDEDASVFPESARAAHGGGHILFLSSS